MKFRDNNHQLKAGDLEIRGLNRRLKEKTSKAVKVNNTTAQSATDCGSPLSGGTQLKPDKAWRRSG